MEYLVNSLDFASFLFLVVFIGFVLEGGKFSDDWYMNLIITIGRTQAVDKARKRSIIWASCIALALKSAAFIITLCTIEPNSF